MANIAKIIEDVIDKAVRQQINMKMQEFVKMEVLKELRRYGIETRKLARERNNRKLSLVESRDFRRQIGSLVMDRIKNGMVDKLRFSLNGLQARNRRDVVDVREIEALVKKAIVKKFGRLL